MGSYRFDILQIMECTIGGTRRHIRELSAGLSLRGHAVTAICSAERDLTFRGDLEEMRKAGVEVVELPMVRSIMPRLDLQHFTFLCRFLKGKSYDVIHTHSSKAGVLGRLAGLWAGRVPLVHTPHTFAFTFKGHFNPLKSGFFLDIERFLGRRTSRLISVSESERRDTLSHRIISSDRVMVVENGIDPWPYRWAEPPEEGRGLFKSRARSPRLGAVGLLNPAKGHDVLLKAFAGLVRRFPEAGLAIVGDGELREELEGLIRELNLEDNAFLVGYRDDVPSLLKELDLFVLPSLWEGLPYVLLEAMASALPAVVTDVNGSRDIVVDGVTGFIVPIGDAEALEKACAEILNDPAMMESMGQEGLRRVMKNYTMEKMLDGVEQVYQSAVDAGRRS